MSKVGFCTICSMPIESFEGLTQCPRCSTKGIPCHLKDQVKVDINIHELRILCIWAENWANQIKEEDENAIEVVYAIAARLRAQLPNGTSLTMTDEFKALREAGYDYESDHPSADREKVT